MMLVLTGLIILLVLGGGAFLLTGIYFALKLLKIHRYSSKHTIDRGLEAGHFDVDFLKQQKVEFSLPSVQGGPLSGFALPGKIPRTVVFCHGVQWTRYGMVKYFPYFQARGWNIVAYDHQGHGESEGKHPTYGIIEKEDLKQVVDWTVERFPQTECLGVYGESMGAATVMQYASLDNKADFLVADCGYSDFTDLLRYFLEIRPIPSVLHAPMVHLIGRLIRRWGHFSIGDISPVKEVMKSPVPLILFHGREDRLVPSLMSEEIYHRRKNSAPTELCLIDEARHAKAILIDRETYEARLDAFIIKVIGE